MGYLVTTVVVIVRYFVTILNKFGDLWHRKNFFYQIFLVQYEGPSLKVNDRVYWHLKNLRPSQVRSSQTERKRGGRVIKSTILKNFIGKFKLKSLERGKGQLVNNLKSDQVNSSKFKIQILTNPGCEIVWRRQLGYYQIEFKAKVKYVTISEKSRMWNCLRYY